MPRPKGDFWIERYRRQADYERAVFPATVTACYSDTTYDVEAAGGAPFGDVTNGSGYTFAVGDRVMVARGGGKRGNGHAIIGRAGGGGSGGSYGGGGGGALPGESLSEVIAARDSDVYGAQASLDARIECVDAEVEAARGGAESVDARLDTHEGDADAHHAQSHTHDASGDDAPKIPQANSHESPDTDSAQSSIHHTIDTATPTALDGSGAAGTAKKASASDHKHADSARHAEGKVKVSSDDTTPAELDAKVQAGTGITISIDNPAGNEHMHITAAPTGDYDDDKVKVSSDDTTPGYVEDKLTVTGGASLSTDNPAGNEQRKITVHARQHALNSADDHTGTLDDGQIPSGIMRDSEHASDAHTMTIDGVDVSAHDHTGAAGHGVQVAHSSLSGVTADQHHAESHVLATDSALGADHTITGGVAGYVLRCLSATTAKLMQLAHGDLSGVTADQHHARAHDPTALTDHSAPAAAQTGRVIRPKSGTWVYADELPAICEQMLNRVLGCQLSTGDANQIDAHYFFCSLPLVNNGILTYFGTWDKTTSDQSVITYDLATPGAVDIVFVGSAVTLWSQRGHGTSPECDVAASVKLDGADQASWNQTSAPSYSLGPFTYGVHCVRLTFTGTGGTTAMRLGEADFHQYPYQGKGVSDDRCVILYVEPRLCVTTIGTAATDNGAIYPQMLYGEAILPRLPLCTLYSAGQVPLRSSIDPGQPYWGGASSSGFLWLPLDYPRHTKGTGGGVPVTTQDSFPRAGLTLTLGGAAARGRISAGQAAWYCWARDLDSAVIRYGFMPFIGRMTAAGAGSAFSVGQLVFGLACYGITAATVQNVFVYEPTAYNDRTALDFFIIPSDLF